MKIALTNNHGKTRWRVNIQGSGLRKRLFFETREEAEAFVKATGGKAKISTTPPSESLQKRQYAKSSSGWSLFD